MNRTLPAAVPTESAAAENPMPRRPPSRRLPTRRAKAIVASPQSASPARTDSSRRSAGRKRRRTEFSLDFPHSGLTPAGDSPAMPTGSVRPPLPPATQLNQLSYFVVRPGCACASVWKRLDRYLQTGCELFCPPPSWPYGPIGGGGDSCARAIYPDSRRIRFFAGGRNDMRDELLQVWQELFLLPPGHSA